MSKTENINPSLGKDENSFIASYKRSDLETINQKIKNTIANGNKVFISPHYRVDFDALGAAVGMTKICESLGKTSYIIVDDEYEDNTRGIGKLLSELKTKYNIITSTEAENIMLENDTLMVLDLNSSSRTPIGKNLDKFENIIVIDHHKKDQDTIETKDSYVLDSMSSTCEIVTYLLLENGIDITPDLANYLLSGIVLDTQNYIRNASSATMFTSAVLCIKGANQLEVKKMFDDSFDRYKAVHELTGQAKFNDNYVVASIYDRVFKKEDIARAAECLQDFGVDISFAMGYININTIAISARSDGKFDVGEMMEKLGGGGSRYSATAQVKEKSILEMVEFIHSSIKETNDIKLLENSK